MTRLPDQYEYPAQAPDEDVQVIVAYNVAWIPVLAGIAAQLAADGLFYNPPADYLQQIEELILRLETDLTPLLPQPSSNDIHFHINSLIDQGNNVSWAGNTSQPFGGYWRQLPAAIGDRFQFNLSRAAGSTSVVILVATTSDSGIVEILLDGVSIGTQDLYSATSALGVQFQIAAGDITNGTHTLLFRMNTKNPSSAGYQCRLTAVWFT